MSFDQNKIKKWQVTIYVLIEKYYKVWTELCTIQKLDNDRKKKKGKNVVLVCVPWKSEVGWVEKSKSRVALI